MDLREIGCEDDKWMELAQDRVQWRVLVLAVLNLGFCYQRVSYSADVASAELVWTKKKMKYYET
jgi:hypothetical protein